jgi:hypothetical protein
MLLIRSENPRRRQAENPLISLSEFAGPALFIVHAAQSHRGQQPRFMAQPPLLPMGEFDPALSPSPVQIAIRQACGLTF